MNRAGDQLVRLDQGRLRRWGPWALAALALVLLLPGNNLMPLMDRDEPRFAEATREMAQQDDWVVPTFNGEYRLAKPILIYWMMRGSYALFGVNEFAARLPSVLCTAALVGLTFFIGAGWFSAAAGAVAAFGLLTCAQVLLHGRSAVADMPMVVCVLAAQFAAWELLHDERGRFPWGWFLLLYGAMGVGFLAKGPVAIAVPVLTWVILRFVFWRRPLPWRRLRLAAGLPLVLLIVGAWGVPALIRTGGAFLTVGIGQNVLARGYGSFEGHGSWAPWYYLATAFFSLAPWIGFAGDGARVLRRDWNEKNAYLVSWVAATYLLFTLYLTKLPHYVMPAFPALFLVLGQSARPGFASSRWGTWWFWWVEGITLLLGLGVLAAGIAWPAGGTFAGLRWAMVGLGGMILALGFLAVIWRRGRLGWSALPLIGLGTFALFFGSGLRQISPALRLEELTSRMPKGTVYGWYRYSEPSAVFYTHQCWEGVADLADLRDFVAQPGPRLVVCQDRELRLRQWLKLALHPGSDAIAARDFADEYATLDLDGYQRVDIDGANTARGTWTWLRVYYRK